MNFSKGDILVPRDAQFPAGAVVVDGEDNAGGLLAHPLGGGFQLTINAEALERLRLTDEGDRTRALFHRARFSLADSEQAFAGWTNGETWNGWARPQFEFGEAEQVVASLRGSGARFDAKRDAFVTPSEEGEEEVWTGTSIAITDGSSIKVYGIGAGSWIWEEQED